MKMKAYPMRRKDRELPVETGLKILETCEYATVAMVDEGEPYCIPVSPCVMDGCLYFHSAFAGRKVEILKRNPMVCVSAVGENEPATDEFTTWFTSAVAWGELELVSDAVEKTAALRVLSQKYNPENMPNFDNAVNASLPRTALYRLRLGHITAKGKKRKNKS